MRRSVPLKRSSAQYDPCPAAAVCVKQRNKKGTRRGDTQRPRAARLEAAIKRNNKQNIREERAYHGQHRASLAVTRLKFHGSFERKRQRRTGLQSCGCSPLSRLAGNFSADSELQTCGYKGYRGPQGTGYVFLIGLYFISGAPV